MELLIGADPEVFVKKDGVFHSAHGLIEGDKKNPQKVEFGAVQVDGMALEFNIDPAKDQDQFIHNVQAVMLKLASMVPEYQLVIEPVAHFEKEILKACPPEALELGCDPDFNAYTGEPNPRPDGTRNFRTGAGHIHIGWTQNMDINHPEHVEACRMLAKQLDVYLGIPSVILDPNTERRQLYGKAGCYRVKPYGMEYRVLSNFWLKNVQLQEWVYQNTRLAFDNLVAGKRMYETLEVLYKKNNKVYNPQTVINESDTKTADSLRKYYGIPMPKVNSNSNKSKRFIQMAGI